MSSTPYSGSSQLFNLRHGLVTWVGADGVPIELAPGDGDASIGEVSANAREATPVRNRGDVIGMVEGNSQEVSFSITIRHAGPFTDPVARTAVDALLRTGAYSSADTRDPAGIAYTGRIRLDLVRQDRTCRVELHNVRAAIAYAETAEGNTISITGTAYGSSSGGVRTLPVVYS